mmetsp:Transcript_19608/g.14065  ORF Transcript_19608/g.14065 Transcript_19608/m.14065 type:complete len:97 (-) Transcript_19608:443-733(-)
MVMIYENINIKNVMYDSITMEVMPALVFRVLQGLISVVFTMVAIKYFSLTTNGVFNNMQPLIVVFFAYFLLHEKLRVYQVICLFLSFSAATMLVVD